MTYGSICSGIEAASVAWNPLGWRAAFHAEIDPQASAVLAHRYPETPNLGDFTTIEGSPEPIDLLVGGTPCQSFSIAGLRGGMADARGNLALEFLRLAGRLRSHWLVWENVPGVLSSNGGRDFGAFLGGLVELGYGFAYRVLDAQHFGVPQRRRRVFVVGCLGDWRRAAAVLFERHCLSRNPPPSREARQDATSFTPGRIGGYREGVGYLRANGGDLGGGSETLTFGTITRKHGDACGRDLERGDMLVSSTLPASNGGVSSGMHPVIAIQDGRAIEKDQNGRGWNEDGSAYTLDGTGSQAIAFNHQAGGSKAMLGISSERTTALGTTQTPAVVVPLDLRNAGRDPEKHDAMNRQGCGIGNPGDPSGTVTSNFAPGVSVGSSVRRLTPRECERLQGFPDDWTLVPYRGKPMADGPRYKMIGNSMAVPVMRWLGRRIMDALECPS